MGDSIERGGRSITSTLNSSTATLAGAATFTGTAELNVLPDVMASCYSDVAGTLYFDFSINGTDWRTFPTSGFTVAAGIHEFHTAVKGPRYFRARYINGAGAQGTFQLSIYYGEFRQPSAPLNQALGLDADAILVRPTFPWMDISRGLVSGMTVIKKFGANAAVGTTLEPICTSGLYPTPTVAVSLEFVSSSASDALNSTGMHEITVIGLNASWAEQTVVVAAHATDGTIAVALTGTWLRVYVAYVSQSGAYAALGTPSHVGTITIRIAGAGATYAQIPIVHSFPVGQALIGAYTVPLGLTGWVKPMHVSVDAGKTLTSLIFFQRPLANDVTTSFTGTMRAQSVIAGISGGNEANLSGSDVPFGPFVGPCDIGYMGGTSSGTADVSIEFDIYLVTT